jgi:opacity protein-like surface antigen
MKQRLMILFLLATLLTPCLAQAQKPSNWEPTRAGKWEFSLQTRYTTSKEALGAGGSKLKLDDDLGWGFGFNYHLNKKFDLGMLFSWRTIGYQATGIDGIDPGTTIDYSNNLSISTFAITGDWNILEGPFTPYINGVLGWTLIDTNIVAGLSNGCYWDPWWGYICGTVPTTYGKDVFTYGLGAGGRFQVSESFFLRAGYEYAWIDAGNIDGTNMLRIDFGFLMN